jgi:hypothetical protein
MRMGMFGLDTTTTTLVQSLDGIWACHSFATHNFLEAWT